MENDKCRKRWFPSLNASRLFSAAILLASTLGLLLGKQSPPANYDETKVGTYILPDPLIFNNGKPVRTANDWIKRRRAEVLELFASNIFGHNPSPPPPGKINYEVFDTDTKALAGKAIRKQVTINFSEKKDGPKEDLLLYIPAGARKPVPVILLLNFFGNQTSAADPAIKLATLWNPRTHEKQQAPEQSRGRASADTDRVLAHGYAFATVCYTDIEPDFKGGYVNGIRPLFFKPGQTEPASDEWGDRRMVLWSQPCDGLPREREECRCEARSYYGSLPTGQNCALGRCSGPTFCNGDLELFGRGWRLTDATELR